MKPVPAATDVWRPLAAHPSTPRLIPRYERRPLLVAVGQGKPSVHFRLPRRFELFKSSPKRRSNAGRVVRNLSKGIGARLGPRRAMYARDGHGRKPWPSLAA